MNKQRLHTIVWKEDKLFVAKFLEIEIASQGNTKKEALDNLKEALDLYLDEDKSGKLRMPRLEDISLTTITI